MWWYVEGKYVVTIVKQIFFSGLLRRCFVCRSRGELGSCKDPFTINATQVENEKGVETVPCASGWCGKILETENALKEGRYFDFDIRLPSCF